MQCVRQIMKKIIIILFFISISTYAFEVEKEISKILSMPEDSIDLPYAFLVLSKDIYPDYDINKGMHTINVIVERVKDFIKVYDIDTTKIDERIGIINTFLFRKGPWNDDGRGHHIVYSYNLNFSETNQESNFLAYTLYTLKGSCATLPMLWISIAHRLGWQVQGVRAPRHIFLRYKGATYPNIDPSVSGGYFSDSAYVEDLLISQSALNNGAYLRSLSKKELIATYINNNATYAVNIQKDTVKAQRLLQIAIAWDPSNVEAVANYAILNDCQSLYITAQRMGFREKWASEKFLKQQQVDIEKQRKREMYEDLP